MTDSGLGTSDSSKEKGIWDTLLYTQKRVKSLNPSGTQPQKHSIYFITVR